MKKILTIIWSLLYVGSSISFAQQQIMILPKPTQMVLGDGVFIVKTETSIFAPEKEQQKGANYLKGMFNTAAGYTLPDSKNQTSNGIVFQKNIKLAVEAYHLEVNTKQIVVQASSEAGFFNAVQSIRQLLPKEIESKKVVKMSWTVPAVSIDDAPRFGWRGMHMDFSRHFFRMDEVKAFLDEMALYKLNTYHMHLTDDQGWRVEIKKYPLLTEKGAWRKDGVQDSICNERAKENPMYIANERNFKIIDGEKQYGGFFTKEQIKEIVKYADSILSLRFFSSI